MRADKAFNFPEKSTDSPITNSSTCSLLINSPSMSKVTALFGNIAFGKAKVPLSSEIANPILFVP